LNDEESLAHTRWECRYHVVFIPKYRRKALFRELRKELGVVFRRLAEQKECRVEEGHMMEDHVHMFMIESNFGFFEEIERGHGVYIVVYHDNKPTGLCFAGYSFD
jgi:REP element-mobilizing transposase RayT